MSHILPYEYLPWDSNFFEHRIGRITDCNITAEKLHEVLSYCRKERIECLYWLADLSNVETVRLAEDNDFRLVDVRLTLSKVLTAEVNRLEKARANNVNIRPACLTDIAKLCEIASQCHRNTRFYFDANFPNEKCDNFYALWIERSCEDFADIVLVAELDKRITGYITCKICRDKLSGQIGLFGVAEKQRGCGVGGKLVDNALKWFHSRRIEIVTVVTQSCNVDAQRLYQRYGFVTRSVGLWYHKWFI